MDDSVFYFSMCHTCKKISLKLKTCSSCKSIYYCCKDHQVKDWPHHKQLCKVIKRTNLSCSQAAQSSWDDWVQERIRIRLLWEKSLKRKLLVHENQMWMFPKACAVCFSRDCSVYCDQCLNVIYCSSEHKNEHSYLHKDFCKSLKICMDVDRYLFTNSFIPTVKLYSVNEILSSFPSTVRDLLDNIEMKLYPDVPDEAIKFVRLADFITPMATLVYTLEKISVIKSRKMEIDCFTVHVVGAGQLENHLDWIVCLEFICHWVKNLKKIKMILVGPELTEHHLFGDIAVTFCQQCVDRKISAELECHSDMYHKIANNLTPANLIVCFNSGIHEFEWDVNDTWKESLPLLMNSEAPIILTSYTLYEMIKDLNRLKSFGNGDILLSPHKNPFSSCKPCRDWETKDQPIFYANGWLCVIKK